MEKVRKNKLVSKISWFWNYILKLWSKTSFKVKLFFISFFILILGILFMRSSNNKELMKVLEYSKKRTEEKLKSISDSQKKIDENILIEQEITDKIKVVEEKIEEIKKEEPKKTRLDDFFDERL